MCERASVGGVKYQRSTIQQSVTEPNQRAASLGGGAERAAAAKAHACAQPLKTPAGGGRKHPEKIGHVGRHAVPAGSPTNRDPWSEVLWTDESELPGHQNRGHVGPQTSCAGWRRKYQGPCNVMMTQSVAVNPQRTGWDLESPGMFEARY